MSAANDRFCRISLLLSDVDLHSRLNTYPAKAGVQSEKLDSHSFDFAQDRFRGNDKYGYRRFPLLEGVFD